MTTVELNGTTLTILRQSSSVPGLAHAASIDLATGACACAETCHARGKAHKHTAELQAVKAAIEAFVGTTGMTRYEVVLHFSRTLKVQAGMGSEWLQYECGQHPDGGEPWAAADTLAHQAAKIILADRAAIVKASKTTTRRAA